MDIEYYYNFVDVDVVAVRVIDLAVEHTYDKDEHESHHENS